MTAGLRRGACPRLAEPMQTGDGLLVRFAPIGTVGLDAFAGLCDSARRHGNGIVEITSRGSIQVRGLTADSAEALAIDIAKFDIDVADGVPIITNPLSGLDSSEILDAGEVAAAVRAKLAAEPLVGELSPKASVIIDGGGALGLDMLSADVRLRAGLVKGTPRWHVRLGGTATSSRRLGAVPADAAAQAVRILLDQIAVHGSETRAHELVRDDLGEFTAALTDLLIRWPVMRRQPNIDPIAIHYLRVGYVALGIGLPFGHAHVDELQALIDAARQMSAAGVRTAPDRILLFVDLSPEAAEALRDRAGRAGFIVRASDPRRHVAACAGAPICASGEIATRAMAPAIAAAAAPLLVDGSVTLHLSGCRKGCAHAGRAAVTVVGNAGECDLIINGSARDRPVERVKPDDLATWIAALAADVSTARRPRETFAKALARLGAAVLSEASHV
jgi:precorrin-3B synthase